MNCLIGLDIGTSAIKCILISEHGRIIGHAKKENSFICPLPERIEFDADERYNQICGLIRFVMQHKPADSKVMAVCLTGASGNAILLDHQKKPIGNAVSWQDERAESTYQTLLAPFSAKYVHSVCGWPKIGSFPLACFSWMMENEPDIYHSAEYYATDFIYFNYRLSGGWAIDTSTATNFYLQNQVQMKYHQPFLDFLHIEEESLPKIVKCGEQIGRITPQASRETDLPEGTVVVAGAFDHPSAARGTGMIKIGDLLLSCGTSWVGFFPVGTREKILERAILIDPFLAPKGPWGAMFSVTSVGDIINRYINLLFNNAPDRFTKFDEAVLKSSPKTDKPCFNLLQKKYPTETYLSSMLKDYSISEVSRSIMECMAKMMREKIAYFRNAGIIINNVTMVGGFAESKVWPQILADILEMPVNLIQGEFGGCFGAAIMAGIGVGLFKNESEGFIQLKIQSITLKPTHQKTGSL